MTHHSFIAIAALLAFACGDAFADGRSFVDGRYPGATSTFALTPGQAAFASYVVACHRDNTRTPYVFRLTREQASALKRATGRQPSRFAVFDTARDVGVDLPVNVIVRFAPDRFEVPHDLLADDPEAVDYETHVIGWIPNPIGEASADDIRRKRCR